MCRLERDHAHSKQEDKGDEIVVRSVKGDHEVEFNNTEDESHLLNFPFSVQCLNLLHLSCFGYECRYTFSCL